MDLKVFSVDCAELNDQSLDYLFQLSRIINKIELLIVYNIKDLNGRLLTAIQQFGEMNLVNEVLVDKWKPEFKCLNAQNYYYKSSFCERFYESSFSEIAEDYCRSLLFDHNLATLEKRLDRNFKISRVVMDGIYTYLED